MKLWNLLLRSLTNSEDITMNKMEQEAQTQRELLRLALRLKPNLIIMGSIGHGKSMTLEEISRRFPNE